MAGPLDEPFGKGANVVDNRLERSRRRRTVVRDHAPRLGTPPASVELRWIEAKPGLDFCY